MLQTGMDKPTRKYTNFDKRKADECRYWQSRPVHERVAAVSHLSHEHYTLKCTAPNVPRLQELLSILNAGS
jgi:hypothetical protein